MSNWETIGNEASIVLVGNFNPKIFHPEWFIRKSLVEEWDYTNEKLENVADFTKLVLPGNQLVDVFLNRFTVRSQNASDYSALKDIVVGTFAILKETPIKQIGMNYNTTLKIRGVEQWKKFGSSLAPKKFWLSAADYIQELDESNQSTLGLLDMTMNLPRPDGLPGHIRPKISAISLPDQTLAFGLNNHVEIKTNDALSMVEVLTEQWEDSLVFAKDFISKIMDSQLGSAS